MPGTDAPAEDLDAELARSDPDRWLASRLIGDAAARADVVAVYALNVELARVADTVTQTLAGEIRLAWWRDRIEDLFAGREAPGAPVLQALAAPIRAGRLHQALIEALIEARHAELAPRPFDDDAALAAYLDGTAGAVMGLAARALSPEAPLRAVVEAGRAFGLAGLLRNRPAWRARGREWVPASWGDLAEAELAQRVQAEIAQAVDVARREVRALGVAAFPAVAYAALAAPYSRGRAPGPLERRLRLVSAAITGRL